MLNHKQYIPVCFYLLAGVIFSTPLCAQEKIENKKTTVSNQDKPASGSKQEELYSAPSTAQTRSHVIQWVASTGLTDKTRLEKISHIWAEVDSNLDGRELLDKVIESFIAADPESNQLVKACNLLDAALLAPEAKLLQKEGVHPFYANNLGLFYARYLTQRRMYDEALGVFNQLDIKHTVAPASFLFYTTVCQHQLLMREEGLKSVHKLLNNTEKVPVSFHSLASLMKLDLEALRKQSLDEISRQMRDSERRLDLGRGGQRVQKVQDEIIASLDAIIKKMEEQSGGGGGGGNGSGKGKNQSSSPAGDSKIMGEKAPGNVDSKKLGRENGWGGLPPKDEARAKNMINKNFPPNYRRAVEEYFKKIADRKKK